MIFSWKKAWESFSGNLYDFGERESESDIFFSFIAVSLQTSWFFQVRLENDLQELRLILLVKIWGILSENDQNQCFVNQ